MNLTCLSQVPQLYPDIWRGSQHQDKEDKEKLEDLASEFKIKRQKIRFFTNGCGNGKLI